MHTGVGMRCPLCKDFALSLKNRSKVLQSHVFPPSNQVIGETLPYDTLQQVRARLNEVSPNLTRYGLVEEANFFAQAAEVAALKAKTEKLSKDPIDVTQKVLEDFYMTDAITR